MPYLAKSLQFQIVFIGMAYVETVNQFENIKFRQLLTALPSFRQIYFESVLGARRKKYDSKTTLLLLLLKNSPTFVFKCAG